jgi:hypothetical protein
MLNQTTLDKLHALRLTGMADAYQKQLENRKLAALTSKSASECWSTATGRGVRTRHSCAA